MPGLAAGPLAGVRVVDLTRMLAGPFGTTILGDLGADVVKVEPLRGDDTRSIAPYVNGQSHYHLSLNRNKRSIALDTRDERGQAVLERLVAGAEILVENFRPGTLAAMGLEPQALLERYPRLVICSISGYGQEGPLRDKVSFDLVTQAMSGAMSVTGEPGGAPARLGIPLGDLIGGFYGVIAVLAALRERDLTGKGRWIDFALHDGMVALLGYMATRYWATGESPGRVGSGHHSSVPYGAYEASDGWLVVACMTDAFWPRLARAIGRDDLADDPRLASYDARTAAREEIDAAVAAALRTGTVEHWCAAFEAADVPHAPILDVAQVVAHPHVLARGMVVESEHPAYGAFTALGSPLRMGDGAPAAPSPPPLLGEHTDEVLAEAGLAPEEIAALRQEGVVA